MILVLLGYIFVVAAIKHCITIGVNLDHGDLIISMVILLSATGIVSILDDIKIRLTEIRDSINHDKSKE